MKSKFFLILRKFKTFCRLLVEKPSSGWVLPVLGVIRLMRPLILIRFAPILNQRIGHLAMDSSFYLATHPKNTRFPLTFHWFWFKGESCNEFWSNMVREKLFVRPWVRHLDEWNNLIPYGEAHIVPFLVGSRDSLGLFQKDVERFQIPEAANKFALAWLQKRGWQEGQPFICLLVRDSKYLDDQQNKDADSKRFAYHNYRDSNIDTYIPAIRYLLNEGYWVIRMGKVAHTPLAISHPHLIDYPFINDQDDILDIYLTVNAKLFISTGSGPDIIRGIYKDSPTLFVNAVPLMGLHSWHNMTWVPKHLIWTKTGKYLTLQEQLQHTYFEGEQYEANGISMIDLSADEILQVTIEQEQRIKGLWTEDAADRSRQNRFWEVFQQWPEFRKFHGWKHPQARIGSNYLRTLGVSFFE